ncbi:MAG TPA: murein biosynthesis integral membrane protein MurJ [Chloroflexota bacterium]|nr:murein biosynthesis integral membrane protein MurJ [Chloroflexota bacterium]
MRIAGAALTLLVGFGLSRVIGALRDIVLAARFGATTDFDLYVAAFRIPDVVFMLIAGGALGSTLVPVFAERREHGAPGADARLASTVFNAILIASTAVSLAGIAFAPQLAPLIGAGFEPLEQARLALLMRIIFAQPVLLGVSEVLSRYLNVRGHFTTPALAPALYNIPIMAAAILLGPTLGNVGLALGVVAGAVLYLLVQLPSAWGAGFRFRPVIDARDPGLAQVGRLMVPRMVGQGAVQLAFIATTRLASQLPEGSLVVLTFAWQLMNLPLGPLGMALGNAALPTLAAQAARGDLNAMGLTARRTLGAILLLILPAAIVLVVAGLPIVRLLYERGAFTPEDSARTAVALAIYAAGLPAHGAIEILTRSFYALHDTRTPVAIGVATMAANVAVAYALAGRLGYPAIPIGMSVGTTAEAIVLWLLLRPRVPGLASLAIFIPDPRAGLELVSARLGRFKRGGSGDN